VIRQDGIYDKYIKRIIDIVCSLLAVIVFSWVYIIIAVLVKIKLGSPVIFKQPRPGKNGKIFYLYKFRTMTDMYDKEGNLLPDEERLTDFGRWLRGTSLDEIPEVYNILKGEMSIIGPRPQLVKDMVFMSSEHKKRHNVRPGLSGLAQIRGRNFLDWNKKLETDLEYIQNMNFMLDCKIVLCTINQVFFSRLQKNRNDIDDVDLTDDYGLYLLKKGIISKEKFEEGLAEAEEMVCGDGRKFHKQI